jgi:ribosomal protein S18 acetylase RimI-like enzyme
MDAALRHPRLAYARHIYLTVWEQNDRALRLYERLGFERVGTTSFTIGAGAIAEDRVMRLDQG